ncbi:MAG: amidohydrolase family protein, partial [Chloroflexota bacterium]|nr:amidohydrolase family protein [Chloroflexota bacterium]
MSGTYDLLIERGAVVDGSGEPAYSAAIGVRDGRLEVIREETDALTASKRIDAGGLVVSPGFIDLHSHSGLMIFADPLHEPKVRQGVTTEVIGVDGLSYAPIPNSQDLEALVHMNAGLDGAPPEAQPYDWSSVESYLDR